jgi:hypothetical protein
MTRTPVAAVVILIVLALPRLVSASDLNTALDIYPRCKLISEIHRVGDELKGPNDADSLVCWGFFIAASQMMNWYSPGISAPAEGVDQIQITMIFRRYVKTHPQFAHRPALEVAVAAVEDAFPCTAVKPLAPIPTLDQLLDYSRVSR